MTQIPDGPVIVYAPQGRDAEIATRVLCDAGISTRITTALTKELMNETCGALLISEQSLRSSVCSLILEASRNQILWSDLPIIILSSEGLSGGRNPYLETLYNSCNVTVIQKPVPMISLITAVRSALRARHRQRQVGELLVAQQQEVQERDEFLSMLSHELRNPLGPILNSLHILQNVECPPEMTSRAQDTLRRQVQQLARMLNDLLDVARISRGRITLNVTNLDFSSLIRNGLDDHRALCEEKGIALKLSLPDKVIVIRADGTRLTQVFGNLLSNAIKFTEKKGVISVELHHDKEHDCAILIVEDNGLGMSPEMLRRLFKPFNQADKSLDRNKGGLGLGLVIAKRLIDMHDGRIEATSDGIGKGSRFTVCIPTHTGVFMAPAPAPQPISTSRNVLIIEDNNDAAETLQILLQMEGHNVEVAYNGPEGIQKAQQTQPDFVFCDIGLPGLDGYQVARALAPMRDKIVKLIALTGYGSVNDQRLAKEAGFDLHLTKPVDPHLLNSILLNNGA